MEADKTGALLACACSLGPVLADAPAATAAALGEFGERVGVAFQLADDLLDATSSAAALGKSAGKDAAAGKQTLVGRIGIDAARRRLGDLVHDGLTELLVFGPEADGLRASARYFATREN
jgi:farnesyl diphosphate synthase